jgi:hypothetical protein
VLVVVLSDLLVTPPAELGPAFDRLLREGADIVVIHVLSRQEMQPDARGEVELVDAETGERVRVALGAETLQYYRARFDGWLAEIEALCAQRGMRYVRAPTDRPVEALLLDDLRRADVLS